VVSDAAERLAAAVILAVGTAPRPWSVPGAEELRGSAVFDDPRELLARRTGAGGVLVVGGGEAAFDYALSLARAGAEVSILVRGDAPRVTGRLRDLAQADPRIEVETGVVVAGLEAAPRGVTAVLETARGVERRAADAVLTAVGRVGALEGLLQAPGHDPGGVERAPGLFVCGDARLGALGQAGIAVGDGLAAATAAVARVRELGSGC